MLNLDRKEVALVVAGIFFLLCMVGVQNLFVATSLVRQEAWAKEEWEELPCRMVNAGIAYRGSCDRDVTLTMVRYKHFAECMGPKEKLEQNAAVVMEWEKTEAGLCAERGDATYRAETGAPVDMEAEDRRLQAGGIGGKRIQCQNTYLPWALVEVHDASGLAKRHCAYQFGATQPSLTGDWHVINELLDRLEHAPDQTCWRLKSDSCVLAFEDQVVLVRAEQGENRILVVSGAICGGLAFLAALLACAFHVHDNNYYDLFGPPSGYESALPCDDPHFMGPEAPLSDRVRNLVAAAAPRLGESTPRSASSGPLSGRGRTVSAQSTPRLAWNLASDFAPVPQKEID